MKTLLFIDTNKLLDFYRFQGKDASTRLLTHIDQNHERIITTNQVEMEFKKRRQDVIHETLDAIKPPNFGGLQPPGFLLEAKPSRALESSKKQVVRHVKQIRDRIAEILLTPAETDPVFKSVERLFRSKKDCHLLQDHKAARQIDRLALRRFLRGQPPRKERDTSYGDAINWEWIIHCAKEQDAGIIIVSRDSDYGETHGDRSILNDFLLSEFQDRVGKKRRIVLTDKLAEGFKKLQIKVTKEEEKEEERLLEEQARPPASAQDEGVYSMLNTLAKFGKSGNMNVRFFYTGRPKLTKDPEDDT